MPIYLAIPLKSDNEPLNRTVEAKVGTVDRYELPEDRGWLIDHEGTSVELSNFLGITGQDKGEPSPVGAAMVVPISTYFGRGPSDMWEWLKVRLEK